ncbi:MAG: hypothetical protein ACPGUZ_04010 [Holosporaceae bacterium]
MAYRLFFISLWTIFCQTLSFATLVAVTPSRTPDGSHALPPLPGWMLQTAPAQTTHIASESQRPAKKQRLESTNPATVTPQKTALTLQHTSSHTASSLSASSLSGAATPPPIFALPNDILEMILAYCLAGQEPGTLGKWRAVCKRFRDVCDHVFPLNKMHIKPQSLDQFRRFTNNATLMQTFCAGMHFTETVGTELLKSKRQQYQRAAENGKLPAQLKPTKREKAIAAYHKRGGTVHLSLPQRLHTSLEPVNRLNLPLTSLNISDWYCLENLDGIQTFSHLTHLVLRYCLQVQTLQPLGYLKNLHNLSLFKCKRLKTLQGIGQCKKLEVFKAQRLEVLQDSTGLNQCPLKVIHLDNLLQLQETSHLLEALTQLEELSVKQCGGLMGTLSINTPHLKKLLLNRCPFLEKVFFQETLHDLHSIDISDCNTLENLMLLNNCKQLHQLSVKVCHQFKTFGMCESLKQVHMKDCRSFVDITPLGACKQLSHLNLEEMPHTIYENLDTLALWNALTHLELHDTAMLPGPTLFKQLQKLSSLKRVTIVPKPQNAEEILAYCKAQNIQVVFTA